jgi:hypothetical protein
MFQQQYTTAMAGGFRGLGDDTQLSRADIQTALRTMYQQLVGRTPSDDEIESRVQSVQFGRSSLADQQGYIAGSGESQTYLNSRPLIVTTLPPAGGGSPVRDVDDTPVLLGPPASSPPDAIVRQGGGVPLPGGGVSPSGSALPPGLGAPPVVTGTPALSGTITLPVIGAVSTKTALLIGAALAAFFLFKD